MHQTRNEDKRKMETSKEQTKFVKKKVLEKPIMAWQLMK